MQLVNCLGEWIQECAFLGHDPIVYLDTPDSSRQEMPLTFDGHRPDVLGQNGRSGREIIGEAKTPKDLDTDRSQRQIQSFLKRAAESHERAFVISTQWDYVRYADSVIKHLCSINGMATPNYGVLDQFGNMMVQSNDWI